MTSPDPSPLPHLLEPQPAVLDSRGTTARSETLGSSKLAWSGSDQRPAAAVARALAAIRAEGEKLRSLADLAEIANYSPFHFARLFRLATGLPPARFQSAVRLDRAKTLLLTTELSVTEVCFEVGFQGLGTFTRRFTAAVGLSPGRFRQLPERYGEQVDRLARLVAAGLLAGSADSHPRGLSGDVIDQAGGQGPCFVGLFPAGISEGRPLAGAVLAGAGRFRFAPLPDGRYHLLACLMPSWTEPLHAPLSHPGLRVGHAAAPVIVRGGRGAEVVVPLRAPLPTDPPLLASLPALLLERAGSAAG